MYTISDKFKTYLKSPGREFEAKLVVNDTTTFDKNSIIEFDIEDSIINSDEFALGTIVSSRLDITLRTSSQVPTNAKIQPYIKMNGAQGETEWVPLGVFYVDSRKHENEVWKYVCFDRLILAQKEYKSNLVYPIEAQTVFNEICSEIFLNVPIDSSTTINITYKIKTKPEGCTIRDVLGFLACMCGSCVKMTKEGKLKFISFKERKVVETIAASEYINCEELNPKKTYTRLVANSDSDMEQNSIGNGTVDNTLFFYNPFVNTLVLKDIYNAINGFEYVPFTMDWRGHIDLEVGDFIKIKRRDGTTIDSVILSNKFSYNGGLHSVTTAPSVSDQQSEYGFGGDVKGAVKSVEKRIGLFILATNANDFMVANTMQAKMMISLSVTAESTIEFNVIMIGNSTYDTVLTCELKKGNEVLGCSYKFALREGLNTISYSFLVKDIQQFSDNLLLFMKVDNGTFSVIKEEAQLYAYGANLIADSGVPYASVTDFLKKLAMCGLSKNEKVTIKFDDMVKLGISDMAPRINMPNSINDVAIVTFKDI